MIAHLQGTVAHVSTTSAVIDVSGVGLSVLCTPAASSQWRVGAAVTVWTHLVVREESLTLVGFSSASERDAFITLQNVQGVGPRLALAMLSVHSPEALAHAVATGDRSALEKVPGVGQKVAARLLLELGGKLDVSAAAPPGDARVHVVSALEGLGWASKAAQAAVDEVTDGPISEPDVSDTLKSALQHLGGSRGR